MSDDNGVVVIDQEPENSSQIIQHQDPYIGLIQLAVERGGDIAQLERLMDLQDRYEDRQAKKDFDSAMSKFQSILPVIEKGGVVDYTSSKGRTYYEYAKIEAIAKAIQPALKVSGISYRFTQSQDQGRITVNCIVTHESGHSEWSELTSHPDTSGGKDPLKAIASAITYLRRYTLTGILGIVVGGEDNDGGNPEMNNQPRQSSNNIYPEEQFNANFPNWEQQILSGKKTPIKIIEFLKKKGANLSDHQIQIINNIGQ